MKTKIILLLLLISTFSAWAQTIVSPTYSRRDNVSLKITEIENTSEYTILKGVYENILNYGWACINNTTYLKDCKSGNKYPIIKSEGLPVSPERHKFTKENEIIHFKFYFPTIGNDVEMVDMIEDEASKTSFNFYGIALKEGLQRDFRVSYSKGQQFSSKPSLQNRINGVKEIQVYIPSNTTDLDKYYWCPIKK